MAGTLAKVATLAAGFGLSGSLATAEGRYHGYEAPTYTVEARVEGAEVRRYAPHILAEVTVRGDADSARSRGFSVLAGYIFGGNRSKAKVDMTAPVTQTPKEKIAMTVPVTQTGDGSLWTVTFMMPADYTLATLPDPDSDAIRFRETRPERRIALAFSGRPTQSRLTEKVTELEEIARRNGVAVDPTPSYAFYDDPFTLPMNRRNEVSFPLR
ncbi:heme-binding protein [Maritimibacter sp. UBA3975]|uniref:SOUL family heme-binding protein n=1 Tax=Maritimibacter sp. UBA3975 TaxID=1946833 RepID=UPI000C0B5F4C|nr:heme-binding protein [Maritimibacter sp. UBA3975]MAM63351.1 SOUL heme-binding protein [Maritimibacter sp.]|tara:strand:+ start:9719 stop:10354 length:636 start_codon:yes stop_codon:yes gene_type:complete